MTEEQVGQFLHVLSGQVADHDAVAHAPIDPGTHDEQTLRTLMQFCDVTVDRRDGDGRQSNAESRP